MDKIINIIKNNLYILKIVFKYAPVLLLSTIIGALVTSYLYIFPIMIFIRSLVNAIESHKSIENIIFIIIVIFISIVISKGIDIFIREYVKPLNSTIFTKRFSLVLSKKAKEIDLECFDNKEYYDDFVWTTSNAPNLILATIDSISRSLQYCVQIMGIITLTFSIDKIMALFMLICAILTVVIQSYSEKFKIKYNKEANVLNRKKSYIERIFYLRDYAMDVRLTNISNKLNTSYDETYKENNQLINEYAPKLFSFEFFPTFFLRYFGSTFVVYIYFAYKLIVQNSMNIADFIAINNGMVTLYLSMTNISEVFNNFFKNSLYIDSMRSFLNYKSVFQISNINITVPDTDNLLFEVKNVSFKYDNTKEYILKNINFKFSTTSSLAIVGYNGAGKTTLIKLLLRLYDVNEGEILLNGKNIKSYDINQYRKLFSATFQDFEIFAATLHENITMKLHKEDDKDEKEVIKALDYVNFQKKLNELPNGLNTIMTKEFDDNGVYLSGGERQKVAIARAIAQNRPIIILDEPTSAIDPNTEYMINKNINELKRNKAVIFISHRLTSTKMADNIIILDQGCIVERGNHEELISLNGQYKMMFDTQAERYRNKVNTNA